VAALLGLVRRLVLDGLGVGADRIAVRLERAAFRRGELVALAVRRSAHGRRVIVEEVDIDEAIVGAAIGAGGS
jgi:hypothetical protein